MADMIKFYKGLEASLPTSGVNGALYITTDEGAIYLGTGTGMKRLGDFVQVDKVSSLPAKAHESCLYYCVAENILAKWNGTEWKQINKQPTAEEMKTLLGLGSLAYLSEVGEDNLSSELLEKVNASAEGNHSHGNKTVLDGITAEKVAAWDAAEGNAKGHADGLNTAMNTRVEALETAIGENGSVANQIKTAIEDLDFTDTAVDGEYVSAVNEVDGKISVTRKALPDYSNTYDAKGAAATALDNAKAYADGLAANYDAKGAAAGVKTELEAEIAKKVDKVEGKDLISTSEIERLSKVDNYDDTQVKADIAKKADAEAMTTELGKKVDKVEGYSLVSDTEIERLSKVDNYDDTAIKGDIAKKADSETMTTELGKKVDKVEGFSLVSDTEIERLSKVDNYDDAEVRGLIGDNADAISGLAGKVGTVPEGQTVMGIITNIQENAYDDTEIRGLIGGNTEAIAGVKATAEAAAVKTEVEAALALKADKSVVEAMYTNTQIDELIQGAKDYADTNDADTKYGIVYDSENKKIKLVEGGTDVEIDASAFIKDGMINTVTIDENDDLIITFNTDAGKENIVLPLDQLVDIYTGVEGERIKVIVNADKSISADLVAGSIGKDYLDEGVKASLALADSALQSHQDISHLATTEALNGVDAKFANYKTAADQKAIDDEQDRRLGVIEGDYLKAADIANFETKENVKKVSDDLGAYKISNDAAVALKANSADVYAKTETFTREEVNSAIAAAIETAHTWGEF